MFETQPDADREALLEDRLRRLYGNAEALPRFRRLIDRWRGPVRAALGGDGSRERPELTERDVVLIAYPDHLLRGGEAPLATLGRWCREHVQGLVSTVHVLPYHPSTSYEGYSIRDYTAVDPALGSREDLAHLARDFRLMVDLVLNHCSASHPWFGQFLDDREPGRRYVLTVADPAAAWLQSVRRARDMPLVHSFETAAGRRHVWTTYSPDLIDLDWREPGVCLEFLEIMLDAVVLGARTVRLDAFAYAWKEAGTGCVALPATHELLRLLQEALRQAGAGEVALLPSITNTTQADNYSYLGLGEPVRQADLVYHLPLSGLLLLALYEEDAQVLSRWLTGLPEAPAGRAYFNVSATHDGIGLTWLDGLIPEESIRALVADAVARGARVSSRRPTATGESHPWEINATWFSACAGASADEQVARLLATQSVVLSLRGVPALYLPVLLAAQNDERRVEATGDNRAINRGRLEAGRWETAVADEGSVEARTLSGMKRLLRARRTTPAFHPEGAQRVLDSGAREVLALERTPPGGVPGGRQSVLCLTNFSARPKRVRPAQGARGEEWRDLLTGETGRWEGDLELAPHQARWMATRHGN
ncbi:MAG TPA: alpha-amylase family glycosyl hydrolase [Myxococcales bacterium]|jgi:sucrose phosphorylase